MKKNITLIITLSFFLLSCGYTAIYSNKKNVNFKIASISIDGNREINNLIKANLMKYTIGEKDINHNISIISEYEKKIVTKDSTGSATDFQLSIKTTLKVSTLNTNKENKTNTFNYSNKTNIKNNENKLEQKNLERTVKNNLTTTIINKIIFDLSNLR
jgi:hypothetical protein